MELQNFIGNFASQFDDTDIVQFSADTRFRDLDEWSSITGLSVIAMIDEEYGVTLKGNSLRNCNTIGDLFEMVKGMI